MINLEKIKWEKCHSSPPLKKTCYCTVLSPPFKKILRFSLTLIEVIKIYSLPPPFKKKGEGGGRTMIYQRSIFHLITNFRTSLLLQ